MKNLLLFLLSVLLFSCNKESNPNIVPADLKKVFAKHGGINTWNKMKTLSFNKGKEVHTVDLQTRKTVINLPEYSLGYNGKDVWLHEDVKGMYKGNPLFYYNLYFYFYAMPFVLADDGIIYNKVKDLEFNGKMYSGYKISYKDNVGTSPDDNYIVYYNPETYKMEWLAYTVTFKTKTPNNSYKYIKYNKWENVEGLLLPKEIVWYQKNDKGVLEKKARPIVEFSLPLLSDGKLADSFFEKPI